MKEINLRDFIECTRDNISDIQDKLDEIILNLNDIPEVINPIKDIDNFMDHLRLDNLMTNELESFIDNYMRYYNE